MGPSGGTLNGGQGTPSTLVAVLTCPRCQSFMETLEVHTYRVERCTNCGGMFFDNSEEEILLQRRQRETDFRFRVGLGFSYRFGSKVANVVNPRLRD